MRLTRRGKWAVGVVWLVAASVVAAGCEEMNGRIAESSAPIAVTSEPAPSVTESQLPDWQCFEDEPCWVGSKNDDRRGKTLRAAFASSFWKSAGMDCFVLVRRDGASLTRCMDGGDEVVEERLSLAP